MAERINNSQDIIPIRDLLLLANCTLVLKCQAHRDNLVLKIEPVK